MKKTIFSISFALITVLLQNTAFGFSLPGKKTAKFSPEQVKEIQKITHNYIVNNPQVLIEASNNLQKQEDQKEKDKITRIETLIPKYKNQIFDAKAPGRVVLGNPDGKIIIAEFTQHQCPSCKNADPIVKKLIKDNPEIKLIVIYWPFFGADATHSAKAVVAAHKQNKFEEIDRTIFASKEFVDKNKIDEIIKTTPGIDSKKLYADMDHKNLDKGLKDNFNLAKDIKIIGTPTFIFTNKEMTKFSLIPGQTNDFEGDIKKAIDKVSK